MKKLKMALDWTPNINHIGILVAQELGFYKQAGLDVHIVNPQDDNYALTPGKRLEIDEVDFAIAPFETVISLNNKTNVVDAVAVYAILQEDISSIAALETSGFSSPKDLDSKIYASYKARYEDKIVQELVKENGGSGDLNIIYPDKLGIWNTLIDGTAHATWIFNNWEGVEAAQKNIALTTWSLKDSGIPYGYSPIILAKKSSLLTNKDSYTAFIKATKQGYLYAMQHKNESLAVLKKHLTPYELANINLEKALDFTAPYIGSETTCGIMQSERVAAFINWIVAKDLENEVIKTQELFTNELLQHS